MAFWFKDIRDLGNQVNSFSSEKIDANALMKHGSIHPSPGGQFSFRVIGPCCRLFDREELPWPCSRLAWKSKEPSWRRIGSRFVADIAARRCPSYSVELLQPGYRPVCTVLTLFSSRFSADMQEWWYSRQPRSRDSKNVFPDLEKISSDVAYI